MGVKKDNAKSRTSEVREASDIRDAQNQPGRLGAVPFSSAGIGLDKISTSGENSQSRDTAITGEQSSSASFGKIASQLIEKVELELAYHESQVDSLTAKLQDLKQIVESASSTDEHD